MSSDQDQKNTIEEKQALKKSMIQGHSRKNRLALIIGLVLAVMVLTGLALFAFDRGGKNPANAAAAGPAVPPTGNIVTYPAVQFDDGKARFFTFAADDKTAVQYFIIKSPDGVIRAAFNACDVCWQAGKGYSQSGSEMVCGNCGRRFDANRINEVQGGCNPAPLKRELKDGKVLITVPDILEGKKYFDFRKG